MHGIDSCEALLLAMSWRDDPSLEVTVRDIFGRDA
jgi:hypothetical protein